MQTTRYVRKVGRVGRITIPTSVRCSLNIGEGDLLEILVEENKIVFRKYAPVCVFCGGSDARVYKGKGVCPKCQALLTSP